MLHQPGSGMGPGGGGGGFSGFGGGYGGGLGSPSNPSTPAGVQSMAQGPAGRQPQLYGQAGSNGAAARGGTSSSASSTASGGGVYRQDSGLGSPGSMGAGAGVSAGAGAGAGNEREAPPSVFETSFDTSSPYFVSRRPATQPPLQGQCLAVRLGMAAWHLHRAYACQGHPQVYIALVLTTRLCWLLSSGCMHERGKVQRGRTANTSPDKLFVWLQGKTNPFSDSTFAELSPMRAHRPPPPPPSAALRGSPK
jgi:hypothetical protein